MAAPSFGMDAFSFCGMGEIIASFDLKVLNLTDGGKDSMREAISVERDGSAPRFESVIL
jgi:hypothetical protein